MLAALAARQRVDEPIAIVVAHPDDETLAIGGSLQLLRDVLLVHVTDGAPRHLGDAARAGFPSPAAHATARRAELAHALALSGSNPVQQWLDIPDQEAIAHVDEIADLLRRLLRRHDIRTVLTHCYEGGHPDHDAVALAAHASGAVIYEFAGYHAAIGGGLESGGFLPRDGAPTTDITLPLDDLARKRAMLACFQSQSGMLDRFDPAVERFRLAPDYDFAAPPHSGRLLCEEWGWMTGTAWRAQAAERAMRRLTVASVAYPLAPVGPDAVGGSEQVLSAIDRALVAAGHRSIVVAMAGSCTAGDLAAYPAPTLPIDDRVRDVQQRRVADTLARVLAENDVDVVHMHGLDFHCYLPPPGRPVLATLHLPPDWYPRTVFEPTRPNTWIQCVSANQVGNTWPSERMLPPILNGVPVDALASQPRCPRNYALMLARVCPEKGFLHLALSVARSVDTTLLIAGEIFPYQVHQEYFAQDVVPLLDRRRRYLGPVGFERKRRLLANARCLLIPSLVAETSSLVAMEAASCGTPVIAFNRGALPEVVEHGRTGFVVDTTAEMAAAFSQLDQIDSDTCREIARQRFSIARMTGDYIARYHALAA